MGEETRGDEMGEARGEREACSLGWVWGPPAVGAQGFEVMAARDQLLAEAAHEAEGYGRLGRWGRSLQSLDAHMKGHQHNLAARASTACQPRKALALVPDLLVAGPRDANVGSRA